MIYGLLADLVVLLHLAFIGFAVFGGLLALQWARAAWAHLPAAAWAALIELAGWICPLTPVENRLRNLAGEHGYEGGFVERYIIPIVYPPGLTPAAQVALGVGVVLINAGVYGFLLRRRLRRKTQQDPSRQSSRGTTGKSPSPPPPLPGGATPP